MTAREKLNRAHLAGSVALGVIVGLAAGTWVVGTVTGVALILAGVARGDIRPDRHGRR